MELERQQPDPKRRKFSIPSQFGGPRRWRGKKSRPCDVCRKRKTACIIETGPPCRYCRKMSLRCHSSAQPNDVSSSSSPPPLSSQGTSVNNDARIARSRRLATSANGSSQTPRREVLLDRQHMQSTAALHEEDELYTLEGDPSRTATYMGPTAEQDPDIVASYKPSLVSEQDEVDVETLQVQSGSSALHDPPVHFSLILNDFPPADNAARQAASDAIESKVGRYGPLLVRLFFKHVHPTWPILMKATFLRQYDSFSSHDQEKDSTLPCSLRGTVYALGSAFWKHDPSTIDTPCPFHQSDLEPHCVDSLRREMIGPTAASLQACLLLQLLQAPYGDSVESSTILALAAQATTAAHLMGLHHDPGTWRIPLSEKIQRRKLWWATFVADAWSAQAYGTPHHIHADMYSTLPVEMDDVLVDEDVPVHLRHLVAGEDVAWRLDSAARFVETVKLARISRQILDVNLYRQRGMPTCPAAEEIEHQLAHARRQLEEWRRLLPSCLSIIGDSNAETYGNNGPLLLVFYAIKAHLLRGLMAPATAAAKAEANSPLRRYIETALQAAKSFTGFISRIGLDELDGFWGRYARSQLNICGNFLIYLFLVAFDQNTVSDTFAMLEDFHESLQKLNGLADDDSRLLIRPVALRIDSFFIFASQISQRRRLEQSQPGFT